VRSALPPAPDATAASTIEEMERTMRQKELIDLVIRFVDAFNRDDLDAVMSFFADDAVYDGFNGTRSRGTAAIRAAFEPQFRDNFGTVRFHTEDVFADADSGKAMVRWRCTLEGGSMNGSWRGLDIVHVDDGLITHKLTYAKADAPRIEA
jgi:ketosteroid isomerase-like protein